MYHFVNFSDYNNNLNSTFCRNIKTSINSEIPKTVKFYITQILQKCDRRASVIRIVQSAESDPRAYELNSASSPSGQQDSREAYGTADKVL